MAEGAMNHGSSPGAVRHPPMEMARIQAALCWLVHQSIDWLTLLHPHWLPTDLIFIPRFSWSTESARICPMALTLFSNSQSRSGDIAGQNPTAG